MEPDVLYVVRPNERNDPLRLSLRSLANIPHRRVFVAGFIPDWVQGVTRIPVRRRANKFDAIEENVRQALSHPELSEHIVYMNDDFYITKPIDTVPVMNGGLAANYRGQQELKLRMRRTVAALAARGQTTDVISYDGVHVPLPLERDTARMALESIPRACLWRTWYGNLAGIQGTEVSDTKIRKEHHGQLGTFVSTGPTGFRNVHKLLEDSLPEETPYVR